MYRVLIHITAALVILLIFGALIRYLIGDFIHKSYCGFSCYSLSVQHSKHNKMLISEYFTRNKKFFATDTINFWIDTIFVEHTWRGDPNNDCKPIRQYHQGSIKPLMPELSQMIIKGRGIDSAFISNGIYVSAFISNNKLSDGGIYGTFSPKLGDRISCSFPDTVLPDSLDLVISVCNIQRTKCKVITSHFYKK